MTNNRAVRTVSKLLAVTMGLSFLAMPLAACGGEKKLSNETSPLVLASDVLDGVFNPFFYTSGPDGEIVGQTQIGMVSGDENGQTKTDWEEPCVAFDHSYVTTGTKPNGDDYSNYYTDYYFALKDNIVFSDGVPLTKYDVLFNMYMYLDPTYSGSSTMYSVAIRGLKEYRTQSVSSSQGDDSTAYFDTNTTARIDKIISWCENNQTDDWDDLESYEYYDDEDVIVYDINKVDELFKEEIDSDWTLSLSVDVAKQYEKYKDEYGKPLITDTWQVFLLGYGILRIDPKKAVLAGQSNYYELIDNGNLTDHSEQYLKNYVFLSMLGEKLKATESYKNNLKAIITQYATASTFRDYIRGKVIEYEMKKVGQTVRTISGIEIINGNTIPKMVDGVKTDVALRDADGTQRNFDILHITIDGVDPKAIQNFSFTVAPGHYYCKATAQGKTWNDVTDTPGSEYYGVPYADTEFMSNVKREHVPLGAGPYCAANRNGNITTNKNSFYTNNVVYFVRNDRFMLGAPKIKYLRYQVINGSLLYNAVKNGEVYYASPSMDQETIGKLTSSDRNVLHYADAKNLGYGYIGINARYVTNIYVRRAIMTTLNPVYCVDYYGGGDYAEVITRPMSKTLTDYYPDVPTYEGYEFDETGNKAREWLNNPKSGCRPDAGGYWVDDKNKRLKYTFTVAGDSTDHPAYQMLLTSAEILNKIGFDITVTNDSTALSKLSAGMLTVWAAAWSSSSDPDMYQVYHKDSKATSTLAWGYNYLLSARSTQYERDILKDLSDLIDDARRGIEVGYRRPLYHRALDKLMELAVEFPTYQRRTFYIWKNNIFDESTMLTGNAVSPYRSPLSYIWKVSYK